MNDKLLFRNADRRKDTRIGAKVGVKFRLQADAARALKTFSMNFSAGGLCLRTRIPHETGDRLHLTLSIESEVFELNGVVAWVRADVIGIRFADVGPRDRERLEAVSKVLAKTYPPVP